MSKPNLAKIARSTKLFMSKHSPEILTGLGIAGMITTAVLAVKATPKALELIDEQKEELGTDELTPVETVKTAWKPYIPAVITGTVSVACLIGASSVNLRRNAALATAYKLSENALADYKEKVVETFGEKKEKVVREKIAESKLEKQPVNESTVILTGKGNTLCLEPISMRYFNSDIDKIRAIIIKLNERMINDPFGNISLNELYDELGLELTDMGDSMGWNISKTKTIVVDFHAKLAQNNEPCIVMDYVNPPIYNYDSF